MALGTLVGAGLSVPSFAIPHTFSVAERKFRISLHPFAIGVKSDQKKLLEQAVNHSFEAVIPIPDQIKKMDATALESLLGKMQEKGLTWDAAGLPVEFRKDNATFLEGMKELPGIAKALQSANVTRMNTWIMPSHDELTYSQNFEQHKQRLREVAKVLHAHNIRLGLEYVGTKTLKIRNRYPFVGTMKEMLELVDAIDVKGVGLQLDSFHWYCSKETVDDIKGLKNEQVVTCDLNDATAGRSVEEQIDGERQLPGDSGLIDLKGFVGGLIDIGYDGPVRAEPFNRALNEMEDDKALAATSKAMWRTVNLV